MPQPQPTVDWPAERDLDEDPEQAGQWMNAFLSGAAAANGQDHDLPAEYAEYQEAGYDTEHTTTPEDQR